MKINPHQLGVEVPNPNPSMKIDTHQLGAQVPKPNPGMKIDAHKIGASIKTCGYNITCTIYNTY